MFINNKIKHLINNFNTDSFSANFLAVILNHIDNEENVIFETSDKQTKIFLAGHFCLKTFDGLILKGKEILNLKNKHNISNEDFLSFIDDDETLKNKGYSIESKPILYVNNKAT